MPELQEIKRTLTRIEKLEREVNLKQLQINSLLAITQAINENVSAEGLFNMYNSFLRWEIGIRKMALFFKEAGYMGVQNRTWAWRKLLEYDINARTPKFPFYPRTGKFRASAHSRIRPGSSGHAQR
jgi:hypothetical protein